MRGKLRGAIPDFASAQSRLRSLLLVHGMEGMRRGLDFAKAEAALKRAAHKAVHGTREERSGRFLVSSTIKSAEYDDDVRELDITFTSGKTYRYFNVPLEIYAEFLDAGSRGKFFNDCIKGAFSFIEVVRR